MAEKNLLITSMQKLINHVQKSQLNQQQIFYSLSRNDFKKILLNLEDDNPMLRRTSLNLMIDLISNNSKLKRNFCKTMQITLIPGKIQLNSKIIEKYLGHINFFALINILKKQPNLDESNCIFWYICLNNKNRELEINFIYKNKSSTSPQINIDPQQCIIGFCLSKGDLRPEVQMNNSTPQAQISEQTQKYQIKNLIQPNTSKAISFVEKKVHSSMSENQPRYQRLNQSTLLEKQRPKKFTNNYLIQRKNTDRGNQTQRYNTLNSTNFDNYIYRDSVQNQISRPSMPVKVQTPYIPTLTFQNNTLGMVSKTDRLGDYPISMTKSKQIDFQKIKYQGIKVTTNTPNNSNVGVKLGYINQNTGRNTQRKNIVENSFKYIKPMSSVHQDQPKYINYFPKKTQQRQKKTIDVFQYIKNR